MIPDNSIISDVQIAKRNLLKMEVIIYSDVKIAKSIKVITLLTITLALNFKTSQDFNISTSLEKQVIFSWECQQKISKLSKKQGREKR